MGVSMSVMALAAYWRVTGNTDNVLTMSGYQNQIAEEYEIPEHVDPGASVDKTVNVKNTGEADSLIRLSVEKMFGDRKEDGTFAKDESLDPEMIVIAYNDTFWMQRNDGYFYYRDILKAGTMTKEPLFTAYTLSEKAGNAYKGKEARIIVRMESIQAEENALSVWGITYETLGIKAPKTLESAPAKVIYLGQQDGFDITAKKTDLFAGFKNLLPGCARTQTIHIENQSDENTEIFLRADAAKQVVMSKRQQELVKELLETCAVIEIRQGKKIIYEGPVSGNLGQSSETMKNDISLGIFKAGEKKELLVKLSLDPEMDNEFMKLTGKVKWIFTAEGGNAGKTSKDGSQDTVFTVYPDKTGIEQVFPWSAAVLAAGILLELLLLCWERRENRKERS